VSSDLNQDPRWMRFHNGNWLCPGCGTRHAGLFDLACGKPEFWRGSEEKSPNFEALTSANVLTEDFCVLDGEHFFVRCVLQLPVVGASGTYFGFGVWATLSKRNFNIYLDTFDSGHQGDLGPWFGWFSNRLKGYPDTLNLKCQVAPREGRNRPYIELESTSHPLAVEQHEGITFDRLLEIYALNGHDLRIALSD
jgi:hypothetical protein